ncbi:MAG: hypothetical protein ACD_62C00176G0016 [uncultured bacterium]|nr:MAG: hypothetical protein ACD_62C00176G0016 [uncultured bacterium]
MKENTIEHVNRITKNWQQGDYVIGDLMFLFGYNPCCPLKEGIEKTNDQRISFIEDHVYGLILLSQTCDVRRDCRDRPYIEMAALQIESKKYELIRKFRMPSYVAVPALATDKIVVDLERVMTFEKSSLILLDAARKSGFTTPAELKKFSWALGRKRSRFAFPDEFTTMMGPLKKRLIEKHGKNTKEGLLLTLVQEIRVRAAPDWGNENVALTFWFVLEENSLVSDANDQIEEWRKLIDKGNSPYTKIDMQLADYQSLTAKDYIESDPLDLEALSMTN